MVFAKGRVGYRQMLQPETIDEMLRPQNENIALDFRNRSAWVVYRLHYAPGKAGKSQGTVAAHRFFAPT